MEIVYNKETFSKVGADTIVLEPFGHRLSVVLPKANEKLNKLWGDMPAFAGAVTMNYLPDGGDLLIRFSEEPVEAKYITHESNHAATMLLNHVGQKFDGEASEILAYLQMYIFDEIVNICKKKGVKIQL